MSDVHSPIPTKDGDRDLFLEWLWDELVHLAASENDIARALSCGFLLVVERLGGESEEGALAWLSEAIDNHLRARESSKAVALRWPLTAQEAIENFKRNVEAFNRR